MYVTSFPASSWVPVPGIKHSVWKGFEISSPAEG